MTRYGKGGFLIGRGKGNVGNVPILPPNAQIGSRGIPAPSTGYGVPTFAKGSGLARGIGRSVSNFVRGILPRQRGGL